MLELADDNVFSPGRESRNCIRGMGQELQAVHLRGGRGAGAKRAVRVQVRRWDCCTGLPLLIERTENAFCFAFLRNV